MSFLPDLLLLLLYLFLLGHLCLFFLLCFILDLILSSTKSFSVWQVGTFVPNFHCLHKLLEHLSSILHMHRINLWVCLSHMKNFQFNSCRQFRTIYWRRDYFFQLFGRSCFIFKGEGNLKWCQIIFVICWSLIRGCDLFQIRIRSSIWKLKS
jgi:hypothetical protein